MIPYGKQEITQNDIDAVINVLKSDFLTQGPKVPEFEHQICSYTGAKFGVATNSATSALHIACLALGLGRGDILWTSPITFVASANCGVYCGAAVDFVDIDPTTYNLCPNALEQKLKIAKINNQLPKVVMPVHLCGRSCEMAKIKQLSNEYGFSIIEDASHAIGGKYRNSPIGSCKYSDITVFSFHPVKIITSAEGGIAVTNNSKLTDSMHLYRSHGITKKPSQMTQINDDPWYYQQIDIGFNYRMTELQAALGISQLQRLDDFVAKRHAIAKRYNDLLSDLPIIIPAPEEDSYSGLHLYVIQVLSAKSRRLIFDKLREKNIGVNVHYIPVHTQPYYRKRGFKTGDFPAAENYYSKAISIPMFHHISDQQQDFVVTAIKEAVL